MIRWLLDLIIVTLLLVLAAIAINTFNGPLRVVLVLPVVLFVPGYAMISAMYPEKESISPSRSRKGRRKWGDSAPTQQSEDDDAGLLGNIERFVLSIALSMAIVGLILFVLIFTVGFEVRRIGIILFGFSGAMIIFAIARRVVLAPEERYKLSFSASLPMGPTFTVMFAISLLVLAGSVGVFALMAPSTTSQEFTGFTVLAENSTTGNLTVEDADTAIMNGETVTILINNSEGTDQKYTVVVARDGEVEETQSTTVKDDSEKKIEYDAPDEGDQLAFYLYKGDAPPNPTEEPGYRHLTYTLTEQQSEEPSGNQSDGNQSQSGGEQNNLIRQQNLQMAHQPILKRQTASVGLRERAWG